MNRFIVAAAAVILSGPALAQTATTTPATQPSATGAAGGMQMADSATVALRYITFEPADLVSSKLIGTDVYNDQNEDVGEIKDLVLKDGKTISGVVLSVGGFLGIGDRYVLVDPSSVVLSNQNGTMRAHVNTSKDDLSNAPEFKYPS